MDIRISIITKDKHVAVHLSDAEKFLDKVPGLKELVDKTHGAGRDTDKVEIDAGNITQFVSPVQTSAQSTNA